MTVLVSPEQAQVQLAQLKTKRGYLLPHHGLLAITAPKLLAAYDETYTALTLDSRTLENRVKEIIWVAILVATNEGIAVHHLRRLKEARGSEEEAKAAIRLAAFGRSAAAFKFVQEHWKNNLPSYDRESAYTDTLEALCVGQPLEPQTIEMTMAAVHTCLYQHWELALHIRRAYEIGVSELALAEAISLTMFPASVPFFVEACGVWLKLIKEGEIPASESLRAWAEIT